MKYVRTKKVEEYTITETWEADTERELKLVLEATRQLDCHHDLLRQSKLLAVDLKEKCL